MMLLNNVVQMGGEINEHSSHSINNGSNLSSLKYYFWLGINLWMTLTPRRSILSTLMLLIPEIHQRTLFFLHSQYLVFLLLFLALILFLRLPVLLIYPFVLMKPRLSEFLHNIRGLRGKLNNICNHLRKHIFPRLGSKKHIIVCRAGVGRLNICQVTSCWIRCNVRMRW